MKTLRSLLHVLAMAAILVIPPSSWADEPAAAEERTPGMLAIADAWGRDAASRWQPLRGDNTLAVIDDELLGRPAIETSSAAVLLTNADIPAGRELTFRLRFPMATIARTSLLVGMANDKGQFAAAERTSLPAIRGNTFAGFNFRPYRTISPVLEEAIRLPLERDMAAATAGEDHWFTVRMAIGDTWRRVWVDDRLIVDKPITDDMPRRIAMQLSRDVRIAAVTIRTIPATRDRFETISLAGYANDTLTPAPTDDPLPRGRTDRYAGIPMQFVDPAYAGGRDHIDLSRSLLRHANWPGYHTALGPRIGDTKLIDPARVQLAIPNGRYEAMYVVAAFDDRPNHLPIFNAAFYRPKAGFPMIFRGEAPSFGAGAKNSDRAIIKPIPIGDAAGHSRKLWLIKVPLDPAMLASFSDMDILQLELTKAIHQFRSYPDPYLYGWGQGGRPSGVRIFALTLERPAVHMSLEPTQFGHVWQKGQTPAYDIELHNQDTQPRTVRVALTSTSYDQKETHAPAAAEVSLKPGEVRTITTQLPVQRNGIHHVTATLTADNHVVWTESRTLSMLAHDTRATQWTPGKGPMFGYWSYHGGHHTPSGDDTIRIMGWAGARGVMNKPRLSEEGIKTWEHFGYRAGPDAWPISPNRAFAGEGPFDPAVVADYKEKAVASIRKRQGDNTSLISFFPEPNVSRNLTAGHPPDYWGEPEYEMNEQEKNQFQIHWNTAKVAAEATREAFPDAKILIPWGDPLYIVPFLRKGFPKHLIDGSALDMIGFERLPEQQLHQQSTHRLYILKNEYRKYGMDDPLLPYVEGTFVPTEPGAVTWQEQAERYHRWSLISLAYGIEQFYSGWFAFDCGNYYGAEHYGGCGIQRRLPYADPKPAYAHFATMTRMLDGATFNRWLPTGSLTTYCLEFDSPRGKIYSLWNVRGDRTATLKLAGPATGELLITDSMDNADPVTIAAGSATITVGESPIYLTGVDAIESLTVGHPDHSGAIDWSRNRNSQTWAHGPLGEQNQQEISHEENIASFGDGSWSLTTDRDELYETNNYDTARFPGNMAIAPSDDNTHGQALAVKLLKQDKERKLMPFYTTITPKKPVEIPGRAAALGVWVKANSDWGRIVYSLRDAKGERWVSIGAKDDWNCDDVHSWSSFNFDGWRYLRFELPSHEPWDSYRDFRTTWWRFAGGDGIVDLPLSIEKVIVERRTHILYVNDIQPTDAENHDVLLGDVVAEYVSPFNASPEAVTLNQLRMPLPDGNADLPNPIAAMADHEPAATKLLGVRDPDWGYDGTRCHVEFEPVEGAKQYQVWVAAHEDGRGAQLMARMAEPDQLLQGLRAATTFYLWVTYTDAAGKTSKASNRIEIKLVDAFGMK